MVKMKNTLSEVDEYIENAAEFAKPILTRIRRAFHKADPDVIETVKWRMPHFEYKGVLGSMAAFKNHVNWGFWKAPQMADPDGILKSVGEGGRVFGDKVTDIAQLPAEETIVRYVKEAMRLNDEKVKVVRKPKAPAADVPMPPELESALAKNAAARRKFDAFPPSHRREYIQWIAEAKQEATRTKRATTAVEWITEGKSRNWKYEKK
jgi:uncharacterized protein YdeI (YjbR/CyaY-like superfamily)